MGTQNSTIPNSQERTTHMNVKELREELDAREIAYDPKAKKADLQALLDESNEDREAVIEEQETKLLDIPATRVTSNYPEEQELIDQGYEMIENNLDKSKTHLIQELQKMAIPTSYISRMLGAHYSFVHTVISTNGMQVVEKRTKSDEMREMFRSGLKVSEVSKLLGAHYSYVHGVHKRWQESEGVKAKVETKVETK